MNIDFYGMFNFGDEDAVKVFVLAHQMTHDAENRAIFEQYGQNITTYEVGGQEIVAPWIAIMRKEVDSTPAALTDWLEMHNNAHQAILAVLPPAVGLPTVDLSLANFADENQMYEWLMLHQQIHSYEQQALGVTGT